LGGRGNLKLLLDVVGIKNFRKLALDLRGDLTNVRISVTTTFGTSIRSRHFEQLKPEVFGVVGEINDFCVVMEAKDVGVSEQRDLLNAGEVFFKSVKLRDNIVVSRPGEVELLVGIENEISTVLLEVTEHNASIPVILDSSTVHCFSDEVAKGLPR